MYILLAVQLSRIPLYRIVNNNPTSTAQDTFINHLASDVLCLQQYL